MWSDFWPSIYTNWDTNQISKENEDCVTMSLRDGRWTRTDCAIKKKFICKHTKISYFPPNEHRVEGQCKDGWWDFGGEYCYFLESFSELKTWTSANEICLLLEAEMLSIRSEHEMQILKKVAEGSVGVIWLGLKRDKTGSES